MNPEKVNTRWIEDKLRKLHAMWIMVIDGQVVAHGSLTDYPSDEEFDKLCEKYGKFPFVFLNPQLLRIEESSIWHDTIVENDKYPTHRPSQFRAAPNRSRIPSKSRGITMQRTILSIFALFLLLAFIDALHAQDNWPQWRGPAQNGVSQTKNLPTTWSETENIVWKTPMPSWSGGTPIIWGDRVFVASPSAADPNWQPPQSRRGRRSRFGQARNPGGQKLLLICLSKKDGKVLWQRELDTGNRLHRKQNNSSPSPVTDGKHVWVMTGTGQVTALNMDGKKIWQKNLQKEYGAFGLNWGYASSPLLYDGKLIIEVLHGMKTDDPSYIVALDAQSGREIWQQERPTDARMESPDAYTTPALLQHNGTTQIVITGGDYVTGHDPETGKELWRAGGLNPEKRRNYRIVASPVVVNDMIYAPTRKKPLLALKAGGAGDITNSHLVWKWAGAGSPDVPTPVCDGTYFYMVDDRGLASCLDAKSGEVIWGPKRTAQGIVSASPVLADGKLYMINEQAVTTVLAAGAAFKHLATNALDGSYTLSSPAVSGSHLFIRTSNYLYCIGVGSD
jgi:outer membrane protein assembly factor BamB